MNRRSDDAAADLDVAAVCAELQLPDVFLEWLRRVEGPDQAAALVLPSNLDADALLQRLAVERDDRVTSNIIQFQRRFTYFNDSEPGDQEILEHIFLRRYHESQLTTQLLDELPQDTDLQRAIVAHLRTGSHWHNRTGWLRV